MFQGNGIGIFVSILTLIAYTFYRSTSWIFFAELKIDEKSEKINRQKKTLKRNSTLIKIWFLQKKQTSKSLKFT